MILTILYAIYFSIYTLIHFVVILVLYVFTAPFDKKRIVINRSASLWAKMIFVLAPGWKIKIDGLENIDRSKVYVAIINHQSMFDIPLVYTLPMLFKWVSKKEVYKAPVIGQVLLLNKDITIDRSDPKSLSKLLKLGKMNLEMGLSICIFPEGTRSKTGRIGRFKEGAFLLAKKSGVGILPIICDGTGSAMKNKAMQVPHTFKMKILEPIDAEVVAATSEKDMAKQMNEFMRAEHKKIREDLYQD